MTRPVRQVALNIHYVESSRDEESVCETKIFLDFYNYSSESDEDETFGQNEGTSTRNPRGQYNHVTRAEVLAILVHHL